MTLLRVKAMRHVRLAGVPFLMLCLALICQSGCTGSDDDDSGGAARDFSGLWVGSTAAGEALVMDLSQTLGALSGTVVIGETSGGASGSAEGNRAELTTATMPVRVLIGTISGENISGTIRDVERSVLDSFSAMRQQEVAPNG